MGLNGKLELQVEIKAPADKFHDVFGHKTHLLSSICGPGKVRAVDLHGGAWGKEKSAFNYHYVIDGKPQFAKAIYETVNPANNTVSYRIIEGDLLKENKSFLITVQAIPKGDGGSFLKWTLEYEKLNENVADPYKLMEFATHISKDVDAHLLQD